MLDRLCVVGVLARKRSVASFSKDVANRVFNEKKNFSCLTVIALVCNVCVLEVMPVKCVNTWYSSCRSVQWLLNFPTFKCCH